MLSFYLPLDLLIYFQHTSFDFALLIQNLAAQKQCHFVKTFQVQFEFQFYFAALKAKIFICNLTNRKIITQESLTSVII